jgi:hypothetical protein
VTFVLPPMNLATLVVTAVAAVCGQHVESHGVSADLPPGWQQARHSLTPTLLDPHEVLSVGTYRLRYREVGCNHMPSSALLDLGPTDALVTLQERHGRTHFRQRPRHFGPLPYDRSEAAECVPKARFTDHWQRFREHGRSFHVLVAFGPHASAKTQSEAWAILDGLVVR